MLLFVLGQIWRGETVLVSKLVADHRESLRSREFGQPGLHNVTGFRPGDTAALQQLSSSMEVKGNNTEAKRNGPPIEGDKKDQTRVLGKQQCTTQSSPTMPHPPHLTPSTLRDGLPQPAHNAAAPHPSSFVVSSYAQRPEESVVAMAGRQVLKKTKSSLIVVSDTATPSRRLMVPMLDLEELLHRINHRVACGLGVSHDDWESMRDLANRLGDTVRSRVEFEWERVALTEAETPDASGV